MNWPIFITICAVVGGTTYALVQRFIVGPRQRAAYEAAHLSFVEMGVRVFDAPTWGTPGHVVHDAAVDVLNAFPESTWSAKGPQLWFVDKPLGVGGGITGGLTADFESQVYPYRLDGAYVSGAPMPLDPGSLRTLISHELAHQACNALRIPVPEQHAEIKRRGLL